MPSPGRCNALLALSLLLLGPCGAANLSAARATTRTVTIENVKYSPAILSAHRGDRIVWVNKDLFPHTVTADNKVFDSGTIAAGGAWAYVVKTTGRVSYACNFHPTMKGSVEVK